MRYADFEVPSVILADFVREMEEQEMQAVIVGLNDDDEIILKVGYEREDAEKVDQLEDQLAELMQTVYEEEGEEEEEEEEDDDENETNRRRR